MNLPNLCPMCLDELPDNYEYDHIAIDRALAGELRLYGADRDEAARVGLARGITRNTLSARLHMRGEELIRIAGGSPPRIDPELRAYRDEQVLRLHADGYSDGRIAAALGVTADTARAIRIRLGLPALFGPSGRLLQEAA